MDYYNFHDSGQRARTNSLPDAHWSVYMARERYKGKWKKIPFEKFRKLFFEWTKEWTKEEKQEDFYEWLKPKLKPNKACRG